ncbi:PAC2 family protein [Chloroflexota bacterium]
MPDYVLSCYYITMRIRAFEVDEPIPELEETHAFAMLNPWVDVGSVGTLVLSWLEEHYKAKDLARLARPGDFFDFTRYRPTSRIRGEQRQVTVPNTFVTYSKQETGSDVLFLRMLEPHSHGEVYIDSILRLLARFNVKKYFLIGSMYDYVPHTRPLIVTGGAVGKGMQQQMENMRVKYSNYQGPTSISFLISQRAPEFDIETSSLIVHLPQYTQMEEDYMGTVRIMEMLSSIYGIPLKEPYIRRADKQKEQINQALNKNPELKTIIEQLENNYEDRSEPRQNEDDTRLSPEVEKFLSEMDRRFRED